MSEEVSNTIRNHQADGPSAPTQAADASSVPQPSAAPSPGSTNAASSATAAPHSESQIYTSIHPHTTPAAIAADGAPPSSTRIDLPDQGTTTAERAGRVLPFFRFRDSHWQWKLGLRMLTLICAIIGMSTIVWVGVGEGKWSSGDNYYDPNDQWVGALSIPLICSVIFNTIVILVLFFTKTPVHPGVAVGVDLVLWLSMFATGFMSTIEYHFIFPSSPDDYSSYGYISGDDGSYRSEYYCGSDDYIYNPSDRTCTYSPSNCPGFDSCAARDGYYAARHRGTVLFAGVVFTWICLVLHFILFVWACVDTHRRNANKGSAVARATAERIVQEMIATGQLVRPQPVFMRPVTQGMTERPLQPIQEYYTPAPQGNPTGKAPEQV